MHRSDAPSYSILCWFCEGELSSKQIRRDGILRSRHESDGGPYRLYCCESCGRENLCEQTAKRRWFCSPNFRFTFLDFLVSRVLDREAEDLLAAISWFRRHEDRRRYFFEQDGDRRYNSGSVLLKLWPVGADAENEAERSRLRRERVEQESRRREEHERHRAREEREEREERERTRRSESRSRASSGIVTPYEILGVPENADEQQIRVAFQRLAIHYHPDKVHHLGEEFRSQAQQKFLQLQAAYESLLARRRRHRRG